MKTDGLKVFCVFLGVIAVVLLFVGVVSVMITSKMRKQYGPQINPYDSMRKYFTDYWLDADVLPRTQINDSLVQDFANESMPSGDPVSQLIRFQSDVILSREPGKKEPLFLPVELTNGGLPLLMVRVLGSPPTKVVLDTASDYLLIADKDACKECSVNIYGGAASDLSQNKNPQVKVYFGSQVDDVQFQVRDIQLGDFATIENVPVGVVSNRKTRIENNSHTFNILGIGAMGMQSASLGTSMIERLLHRYDQPNAFGFYFGADLRDGLFVLGYAAKKSDPILSLPLYPHPTKPYYLVKINSVELIPTKSDPVLIQNDANQLPEMLVDTGANFMALPSSLEKYFKRAGRMKEMYFHFETEDGLKSLRIPKSRLYNRKNNELFYFSEDRAVLGTFIMSLFSYVEFDFVQRPMVRFWV